MTWLSVLIALGISTTAFFYLAHVNAKRRRAFKLPDYEKPMRTRSALFLLVLPGLFFLGTGSWPALTVWVAGITVIGWIIAATSPVWLQQTVARHRHKLTKGITSFRQVSRQIGRLAVSPARVADAMRDASARIAVLEARISALEGELAGLKSQIKPVRKKPVKREKTLSEPLG